LRTILEKVRVSATLGFDVYGTLIDTAGIAEDLPRLCEILLARSRASGA